MSLPASVRVKLSTEAAGSITITPVVVQELPTRDLVEHMLGITGKDEARVHELLLRGTLVSGASRFRWTGWDADLAGLRSVLATFPDPEPSLPFAPERCLRAVLRGGGRSIEIPREIGAVKPFLRPTSFWDVLMGVATAGEIRYVDYSYKERADCYCTSFSPAALARLREGARLIKYTTLRDQIRTAGLEAADLYVSR